MISDRLWIKRFLHSTLLMYTVICQMTRHTLFLQQSEANRKKRRTHETNSIISMTQDERMVTDFREYTVLYINLQGISL